MRRILRIIAVVIALGATVAAVATAPDSTRIAAAFPVRGAIGDTLYSRQLVVTATGVRLAQQLKAAYADAGNTATDGVWVIVDADMTPRLGPEILDYAAISIDGVAYQASDILPYPSGMSLPYGAGVTTHGSLVFELPESALKAPGAAHASIIFNVSFAPQLDTVPTVIVDLTALPVDSRAVIDGPYVVDKK